MVGGYFVVHARQRASTWMRRSSSLAPSASVPRAWAEWKHRLWGDRTSFSAIQPWTAGTRCATAVPARSRTASRTCVARDASCKVNLPED